jgi:prepilin-type N-terminal cleavage/methylation domain-containing protein
MNNRRGLTLVELLIAMVVAAVIGTSLVALLLRQSQFSERLTAERDARAAGRSPVAILGAELRMVDPEWGIESATTAAVVLRIPYAMGVFCGVSGGNYHIQLLPTDPTLYAQPGHSGFAVRQASGAFAWVASTTRGSGTASVCTSAVPAIETLTGSSVVTVPDPGGTAPDPGTPIMLARRIEYSYANSATTGLRSLFRRVLDISGSNPAEEIGGPYTTAAAAVFGFYLRATPTTLTASAPGTLSDMVGLNVGLPGRAERNPRMATQTVQADLSTAFYFTNRRF